MKKITLFLTAACAIAVLGVQLASAQTAGEVVKKLGGKINDQIEKNDEKMRDLSHKLERAIRIDEDLATVKKILDASPSLMYGTPWMDPAFCVAARGGTTAMLQYMASKDSAFLRDRKACAKWNRESSVLDEALTWRNDSGNNALWLAVKKVPVTKPDQGMWNLATGSYDLSKLQTLVPYLLKQGADPYATSSVRYTPYYDLFYGAAYKKNGNFIKVLKNETKRGVAFIWMNSRGLSEEDKAKRAKEAKDTQAARFLKEQYGISTQVMWTRRSW